ncbi:MAG: tRNA(5-methylaminomethyl-2-thiouridylate) methyltransferase, partial [Desulfovibrio sp.]|nr:tRNA(5-methylaminomethyl-2-thiouridylate) methyltransferase [Desulfovibrio sp.]
MLPEERYDVVSLFSGGLDSLLASRLIQAQGKKVLCLHFVTPFFGKPHLVDSWRDAYGLTVLPVDVGREFVDLLVRRPQHGFGKVLNPCVDCKILLLRRAREMMEMFGAKAIITGEVLGQRPMSQRRDSLNLIRREAGVRDLLLRPLCALRLEPTPAEISGFINRSALLGFSGRGRKNQMALAGEFGIAEIPSPAGGCRLTERESARG